jgi:hypothetical protein
MYARAALGFVALLAFSMPAHAGSCGGADHVHDPKEMASKYFDKMDKNNDKVVTKAEFEASPFSKMLTSYEMLQPNEAGVVERKSFIKTFIRAHSKKGREI